MKKLNVNSLKTIFGGDTRPPRTRNPFPSHCFAEDTMLTTNNGPKMISDLDLDNDRVWNPMNQQWMNVARRTMNTHEGNVFSITTNRGTVTVTESHAFMLLNGEVVKANELNKGDLLADGETGDFITNIEFRSKESYTVVYNLVFENEDNMNPDSVENFFVEANGVVAGILFLQDKIAHRVPNSKNEFA